MDDQDWYEKDLDDFEEPQVFDEQRLCPRQTGKANFTTSDENPYPYDLWYLISKYIAPEDIGRFALICRQTNQIVNTTSFLDLDIHKVGEKNSIEHSIKIVPCRYIKLEAKRLSYLLKGEHSSIVRTYVIRSLHKTYGLLQKHSHQSLKIQNVPSFLLSYRCVRIWHSKYTSGGPRLYNYYFEFSPDDIEPFERISSQLTMFENPHQQYLTYQTSCLLHVISSNHFPMGPYMGLRLSRIGLHMSSDLRSYQLKMSFHSSKYSKENFNGDRLTIIIDPILCLKIYKWYNMPSKLE